MEIRLNTDGVIKTGKYKGWYLSIEPYLGDSDNGYIILISEGRYDPVTKKVPEGTTAYDTHAIDMLAVIDNLEAMRIKEVKWLD